ncbi:hypothetical protein SEPCBS119000_003619 [Sporothrix epigloea]|uniref:HNH nuclease domain-containing protein n=1 Tax=Sporothrix epigloea TaxID=1892477 RepID=A0ABP0DMM4_9PEZI
MSSPSTEELEEQFLEMCKRDKELAVALMTLAKSKPRAVEVMAADLDHELLGKSTKLLETPSPMTAPKSATEKHKRRDSEAQQERLSPPEKRALLSHAEGQPGLGADQSPSQRDLHDPPSLPGHAGSHRGYPAIHHKTAVERTVARDGNACVLTTTEDPQAVYIVPHSASPATNRAKYIARLASLWGDEKADAWSRVSSSPIVTESPQNLLCLTRQHVSYWQKCRLALRPIRTLDPCTIKVQLHWLRRAGTTPDAPSTESLHDLSLLCGGGKDGNDIDFHSWGEQPLAHRKSGLPLRTGQIFTIRAQDPEDLPSYDLLDMRWNLQRIAVMSGAIDPEGGMRE